MNAIEQSSERIHIADLLVAISGFGIGFALLLKLRSDAYSRATYLDPNPWLFRAGPLELILTGLALGCAYAYPFIRLRERCFRPDKCRMLAVDLAGCCPLFMHATIATLQLFSNEHNSATAPVFFVASLFVGIGSVVTALASMCLAVTSVVQKRGNWIEMFAYITASSHGLVLFRALSMIELS